MVSVKGNIEEFISRNNDINFKCEPGCFNCCHYPSMLRKDDYNKILDKLDLIIDLISDEGQREFIVDNFTKRYYPLVIKTKKWKKYCMFLTEDKLCSIHLFCLNNGIKYWDLKPFGCSMYPSQKDPEDGAFYFSFHHCPDIVKERYGNPEYVGLRLFKDR